MMLSSTTRDLFAFLSRALIALLFLPTGIGVITGFGRTVAYISGAHVPFPEVAALIAIAFEVGVVVLLLVGYQTRWSALALIFFIVVITFIFHRYWDATTAAQVFSQKFNFYKNLAIAGGLFSIAAWGPGSWSIDARQGRETSAAAARIDRRRAGEPA